MKKWLKFLVVLSLLLPLHSYASTPKDILVIGGNISDLMTLDPAEVYEENGMAYLANVYQRLVAYDFKDLTKFKGVIADKWTISDDGKTYKFFIKKGLKFHSGNPITAHDAAYSFQRVIKLGKNPSALWAEFGFTPENVEQKIRAENDEVLVIEIGEKLAPNLFLYCLTAGSGAIIDRKLVQSHAENGDFGNAWLKVNEAGSGAFKLKHWKKNESLVLERHDGFAQGPSALAQIHWRHVPELTSQQLLLEKGDIDLTFDLGPEQLNTIRAKDGFAVIEAPRATLLYLGLNQKNQYLQKPEVVEAFKWLIDYQKISETLLKGKAKVHQTYVPEGFMGSVNENPYSYNPEKAKELLKKAGLENGFTVTMDVMTYMQLPELAKALQNSFAAANIKLELVQGDLKQVITKYRNRQHDIYIGPGSPNYPDPNASSEGFVANSDNSEEAKIKQYPWRNNWQNKELTELTAKARQETDPKKRQALYEELQRRFLKESPIVVMFQKVDTAATTKNVKGLEFGPTVDTNYFWGVSKQ